MRNAGTVLAVIGCMACLYFVVVYHVTTSGDWWHSAAGRHLMQFTANLGLLFGLIVGARVWPDYPGRDEVTLLLFASLVGQVVWRSVLLHRVQHEDEPAGR